MGGDRHRHDFEVDALVKMRRHECRRCTHECVRHECHSWLMSFSQALHLPALQSDSNSLTVMLQV